MRSNVDGAKKSLQKAKKEGDAHKIDIQELEIELRNIERKKEEFDETTKEETQSQFDSTAVILADDQIEMYQKPMEKANKESERYMSELDTINREHRGDQDKLNNKNRNKLDMESKLKNKGNEQEEGEKRLDKLNDHIQASETQLEEQKTLLADLSDCQVPTPDYRCIIARHCQEGDIEGASQVLKMMLDQGIKINENDFKSMSLLIDIKSILHLKEELTTLTTIFCNQRFVFPLYLCPSSTIFFSVSG